MNDYDNYYDYDFNNDYDHDYDNNNGHDYDNNNGHDYDNKYDYALQTNQEEKVKFNWHYCYDFVTPLLL